MKEKANRTLKTVKEHKKEMCLIVSSIVGTMVLSYLGRKLLYTHHNIAFHTSLMVDEKTGYQWIKYWFTNKNRFTNKSHIIGKQIGFSIEASESIRDGISELIGISKVLQK